MFQHHNIHKYTLNSPDGKKHNQIDHVFIHKIQHQSIVDVRSVKVADCDTIIWWLRNLETVSK
jgi:hypothetical protein